MKTRISALMLITVSMTTATLADVALELPSSSAAVTASTVVPPSTGSAPSTPRASNFPATRNSGVAAEDTGNPIHSSEIRLGITYHADYGASVPSPNRTPSNLRDLQLKADAPTVVFSMTPSLIRADEPNSALTWSPSISFRF